MYNYDPIQEEYDPNDYTTADDYCRFMQEATHYLFLNGDFTVCDVCGGTGLEPIICCSGMDCGCYGLPIDFKLKCSKCKLTDVRKIR